MKKKHNLSDTMLRHTHESTCIEFLIRSTYIYLHCGIGKIPNLVHIYLRIVLVKHDGQLTRWPFLFIL